MAAPIKDSLDYFPFDCGFFEDKTIKGLRAKFQNDGIVVYLYLLCIIYRDNGYYTELDEDLLLDITDTMHIDEQTVKSILDHLTSRNLFDKGMVEKFRILTSRSIQRRFQVGKVRAGGRRKVEVKKEYWLLTDNETEKWIELFTQPEADENVVSEPIEHHEEKKEPKPPKEKKAKEKKEVDNKKSYAEDVKLTEEEYNKLCSEFSKAFADKCIAILNNYKMSNGKKYKSDYYAIRNWVIERVQKEYPNLKSQCPQGDERELFSNPFLENGECQK